MAASFRFLHASDLHLERPPCGIAEVPDALRPLLVEAPYRAAERLFDAALKHRVDFVVLAGDVVNPRLSGPRGLVFLRQQFARLAAAGIWVYWAQGRDDRLESVAPLWRPGDNVVLFQHDRVERVVHRRDGLPIAEILGTSNIQKKRIGQADFVADDGSPYSIAIAYGRFDIETLGSSHIDFWALGGDHRRHTVPTSFAAAHYPGTPQGRRPGESGPRGCTLVEVDVERRIRTDFIATDALRFVDETIELDAAADREALWSALRQRTAELTADPFGPDLLIRWTIACGGTLERALERGSLAGELTSRLRAEYASVRPATWTIALWAARREPHAGLYESHTIQGEFLRTVRHWTMHPEADLDLEPYLSSRQAAGTLGVLARLDEPQARAQVLAEVARLGLELLTPDSFAEAQA